LNILDGKTALITGATGGIGTALAKKLVDNGCDLILACRSDTKYVDLANRLKRDDTKIEKLICDFQNDHSVSQMISEIKDTNVDILINAAGLFPIKTILNSTLDDYGACFDVNVKIPFILSSILGKGMCNRQWGRIVNIGSSSSYNGSPETGLYCASKHALLGLSRSQYQEFKSHNVRVYSVSPGSVQTNMGKTDTRQDFTTFITPEEVAEYICFIMSFDGEGISEETRINRMVIR
jgi:short-subunit dehydrogenase